MGKKNDEIAKMVENLQNGDDNALERKTANFSMRISPKLKADLYSRAARAGLGIADYLEIIIGEIERDRVATKALDKAQSVCSELETENEKLSAQLAENTATLAPLEAIYSKVKSKNLQKFKGKDISTLPKFVKELSNLIIV